MRLSPHFTLAELTASPTAKAKGIENIPTIEQVANLIRLAKELEKVRALTGRPLKLNSGFRGPALNAAVGGHPQSAHKEGRAADFDPPKGWTHDKLQQAIAKDPSIQFDIVLEEGTVKPESEGGSRWLHFAIPRVGEVAKRKVKDATVDQLGGTIIRVVPG